MTAQQWDAGLRSVFVFVFETCEALEVEYGGYSSRSALHLSPDVYRCGQNIQVYSHIIQADRSFPQQHTEILDSAHSLKCSKVKLLILITVGICNFCTLMGYLQNSGYICSLNCRCCLQNHFGSVAQGWFWNNPWDVSSGGPRWGSMNQRLVAAVWRLFVCAGRVC